MKVLENDSLISPLNIDILCLLLSGLFLRLQSALQLVLLHCLGLVIVESLGDGINVCARLHRLQRRRRRLSLVQKQLLRLHLYHSERLWAFSLNYRDRWLWTFPRAHHFACGDGLRLRCHCLDGGFSARERFTLDSLLVDGLHVLRRALWLWGSCEDELGLDFEGCGHLLRWRFGSLDPLVYLRLVGVLLVELDLFQELLSHFLKFNFLFSNLLKLLLLSQPLGMLARHMLRSLLMVWRQRLMWLMVRLESRQLWLQNIMGTDRTELGVSAIRTR